MYTASQKRAYSGFWKNFCLGTTSSRIVQHFVIMFLRSWKQKCNLFAWSKSEIASKLLGLGLGLEFSLNYCMMLRKHNCVKILQIGTTFLFGIMHNPSI